MLTYCRCYFQLPLLFVLLTSLAPGPYNSPEGTNPEILLKLGNFYLQKQDTKTAVQYYHRLIPRLARNSNYASLGDVYYKLARIAKLKNKFSDAILLGEKSIQYFDQAGDRKTIIYALNFLGVLYKDMGFAEKSLQLQLRALKMAEQQHNDLAKAMMLVNLSEISGPENTGSFLYRALATVKKVNNDTARGYVYNTLGMYNLHLDRYDSARYYFDNSLALRRHVKDYQGIAFTLNNIGEVYFLQGESEKAFHFYSEALKTATLANDPLSMCISCSSLAGYYKKTGNDRESIKMLLRNLELSKILNYRQQELYGLEKIAGYYEQKNQPALALSYLRKYITLKDTLLEEKRLRTVAEIKTRYNLTLKEQEITRLQSDNKINTANIQRKQALIAAMLATIVLILTASWFTIRAYRDKLSTYRELVRKDMETMKTELGEEQQVQRTLHAIRTASSASAPTSKSMIHPSLPDELQERLYKALLHIMKVGKRFLDPGLTLADVARELNTNTSYLSRIINDRSSQNFSQFLNDYRIREARKLLADPAYGNLSIEGIAQTVGYNSKSAFNSAFKTITGVTPSFYQQSAKQINAPELKAEKLTDGLEGRNYSA